MRRDESNQPGASAAILRTLPLFVLAVSLAACGSAGGTEGLLHSTAPTARGAAPDGDGAQASGGGGATVPVAELALPPGESVQIAVTVRVLTPEGDPVVGQPVRVDDPQYRRCIGSHAFAEGETDEHGVVVLRDLDPEQRCDLEILRWVRDDKDLGGHYERDWLPRNRDVVLPRFFSARGRVLDIEGEPIAGAVVLRTDPDHEYTRDTGPDGRFEFEGVPKGQVVHVRAMPCESYGVPGKVVPITAGGEQVVVEIDRGADFVVRIRNGPTKEEVPGYRSRARMTCLWNAEMQHLASVSDDGTVTFRGLRTDASYALWVPGIGESPLHYYRSGLRVGDGPLEVDLVPGESIRVTVRSTNTHRRLARVVGPGFDIVGRSSMEDGDPEIETILIEGVPRGEWEVVAESGGTKLHLENERRVRAHTGTSIRISLPEPPKR